MTVSKMTRILVDLAEKKDYGVFYLIDSWQLDNTKRVREIIKVSDLAKEFKEKKGRFFEKYKLGVDFKELAKHIEKGEEMQIKCFYKDSYEAFVQKWESEHPGVNYKEYIEKKNKKLKNDYTKYMGSFGLFGSGSNVVEAFNNLKF